MRAGRERRKSDLIYLSCCYSLAIRGKPFPISLSPLIKLSVWVGCWVAAWDDRSLGADKRQPCSWEGRMHKVAKSQWRKRGPDRCLLVSSSSLLSFVHSVQSHDCKRCSLMMAASKTNCFLEERKTPFCVCFWAKERISCVFRGQLDKNKWKLETNLERIQATSPFSPTIYYTNYTSAKHRTHLCFWWKLRLQ